MTTPVTTLLTFISPSDSVDLYSIPMKPQFALSALILALAPVSGHAANLLVNGGFETNTGGIPNSWTYAAGADGPATVQSTPSSPFININPFGAAAVLLTDGATTITFPDLLQTFTTQTAGILNVAWDFRLNTLTGSSWGVQIDDSTTSQTRFNMDASGNFVVENQFGATTTIMPLVANTWYQVQVTLNMNTKRLSGTITSESLVATAIPDEDWRVTGGSNTINRVLILDNAAAASGNILFDNFAADRLPLAPPAIVPEPSALLLLGLGGVAAAARRKRRR